MSCRAFPFLSLSCHVLPCRVLSCNGCLSCRVEWCRARRDLSRRVAPCIVVPCLVGLVKHILCFFLDVGVKFILRPWELRPGETRVSNLELAKQKNKQRGDKQQLRRHEDHIERILSISKPTVQKLSAPYDLKVDSHPCILCGNITPSSRSVDPYHTHLPFTYYITPP